MFFSYLMSIKHVGRWERKSNARNVHSRRRDVYEATYEGKQGENTLKQTHQRHGRSLISMKEFYSAARIWTCKTIKHVK